MLQNRVATLKSINIAQVIDIHIFTKVKSDSTKLSLISFLQVCIIILR